MAGDGDGPGAGTDADADVGVDAGVDGDADAGAGTRRTETDADADVVLTLPEDLRSAFKEPLGPVYTDAGALLADASPPIIAVGDIVTYHLTRAGRVPDVAVVDGRTKRAAVGEKIEDAIGGFDRRLEAVNPAGTLAASLLEALRETVAGDGTALVSVDGEEDLAALPAVVVAPAGASVVYGQPDRGMVLVAVDAGSDRRMRDLLGRMAGDHDRLWALLGVDGP